MWRSTGFGSTANTARLICGTPGFFHPPLSFGSRVFTSRVRGARARLSPAADTVRRVEKINQLTRRGPGRARQRAGRYDFIQALQPSGRRYLDLRFEYGCREGDRRVVGGIFVRLVLIVSLVERDVHGIEPCDGGEIVLRVGCQDRGPDVLACADVFVV